MPRVLRDRRASLSRAQVGLLARIARAEPLTKRDIVLLRSLELRFIIKLRRSGCPTYPLDPVEYVLTEKGQALLADARASEA